jgi:hypothetical protein
MEGWMRALTCASYDYLHNAVSDLQRQVAELSAAADGSKSVVDTYTDTEFIPIKAVQRLNPFNGNANDVMPVVFPSELFEASSKPRRPRTFEEMHYDFGERILSVMNRIE